MAAAPFTAPTSPRFNGTLRTGGAEGSSRARQGSERLVCRKAPVASCLGCVIDPQINGGGSFSPAGDTCAQDTVAQTPGGGAGEGHD
jgi:hypothetical protein